MTWLLMSRATRCFPTRWPRSRSTRYTRPAVDRLAFGVPRLDLARERLVAALTLATLARAPGIKARPRNFIDPAHQCQIVLRPVYFDEGEDFRFRSILLKNSNHRHSKIPPNIEATQNLAGLCLIGR